MYKNILALDTSDAGHLVLRLSTPSDNYDIVSDVRLESDLISAIDSLLQKSTLSLEDIDKFVLGQGAGSFMGLRLGFAVFRTWVWLYQKPIALVSSLELLARSFDLDDYDICIPCIDAKMKKVFARVDSIDSDIIPSDLVNKLPSNQKIAIIGSGADILKEYIEKDQLDKIDFYPDFKMTAECFEREFISKLENIELPKIVPNYLRLSAAETALLEKKKNSSI